MHTKRGQDEGWDCDRDIQVRVGDRKVWVEPKISIHRLAALELPLGDKPGTGNKLKCFVFGFWAWLSTNIVCI